MKDDDIIFDSDLLGFPAFDSRGNLPAGVQDCSFRLLAENICFNGHRQGMWRQLVNFPTLPVLGHAFSNVYLGGDFISSKADRDVVDILLETRSLTGPRALARLQLNGADMLITMSNLVRDN